MRDVRALDNVSFTDWFKSHGGSQASIDRMWDPIGERRCCSPFPPSLFAATGCCCCSCCCRCRRCTSGAGAAPLQSPLLW